MVMKTAKYFMTCENNEIPLFKETEISKKIYDFQMKQLRKYEKEHPDRDNDEFSMRSSQKTTETKNSIITYTYFYTGGGSSTLIKVELKPGYIFTK